MYAAHSTYGTSRRSVGSAALTIQKPWLKS
jgi:hypothetical protein